MFEPKRPKPWQELEDQERRDTKAKVRAKERLDALSQLIAQATALEAVWAMESAATVTASPMTQGS